MARFPTVAALAAATAADVLRAWQGLGYDRRAWLCVEPPRRSRRPRRPGAGHDRGPRSAPGVGPYTARAVVAIAFGRPAGAVDVNVRRVLAG